MKRNSKQDWTQVLQERLRDVELAAPPFADMPGQPHTNTGGCPGKGGFFRMASPWPWALGSVAVAALAGVIFLRTPDSHSRLNPMVPPVIIESTAPSSEGVRTEIPGQARNDENDVIPTAPAVIPAEEPEPPTPDVISAPAVIPAEEPEPPTPDVIPAFLDETATGRRPRRGPVSLRLQASYGGISQTGPASRSVASYISYLFSDAPSFSSAIIDIDGSLLSFGSSIDNPDGSVPIPDYGESQMNGIEEKVNDAYSQQPQPFPVSIGISVAVPLSRRWLLSAGLDYTQRGGVRSEHIVSNEGRNHTCFIDNVMLHYLGLPLDVQYYFNPDSRLRFYLGAGVKAEKCFYVKGARTPLQDPFLFSGNLQAGADFRLLPGVRLYLAPSVTQYFNQSAYYATWDDRPVFALRAGLSFDLK